jgi:hypothetical protein
LVVGNKTFGVVSYVTYSIGGLAVWGQKMFVFFHP